MRQLLINSSGALVARMPRPPVTAGCVLVRVRFSLVSTGTELASLRADAAVPAADAPSLPRVALRYLGKALRDPRKAAARLRSIARNAFAAPPPVGLPGAAEGEDGPPLSDLGDQGWNVGYSAAGEVVAVGEGIDDLAVGDYVACAGAGRANHADYVSVPRNLVCRVPAGCDLQSAATTTVGTIALQGVRRAAPELGEMVAVLGLGLIGQITAQILRANGTRVLGLDLDPARVARAKALGLEAGESDPAAFARLVRDATAGRLADRVLVTAATKSDAVVNLALEVARRKATVVIVGDVGLRLRRDLLYPKELDVLMSTSYGPGRYDRGYEDEGRDYPFGYVRWTSNRNMQAYLGLIASARIDVARLIERVVPVSAAPQAYRELAQAGASAPLGVLLSYPDESVGLPEAPDAPRITLRGARRPPDGVLRYALVGAGAFGTGMLVPQMARRKDRFFLRAVVSRNTTAGGNFARANQVEILATELDAVLEDPQIDLVVIATRHHEHADQAARSLAAGKHVFVEKPLAIRWEELERLAATYDRLDPKPLAMVGFNRRFSPAMQALQRALQKRRGPWMASYRVNAGYVPPDSWLHGPQGGGRNIGEACHMYDCFRFLSGAPLSSIEATALDPGEQPYRRNDNFSATLRYADGSVGTLLYTALGPKAGISKERLEVFCDGEAYVLDDYASLVRSRDNHALWGPAAADKGHFEELSRFGDAIAAGDAAPIAWQELMETSAAALRVQDLLAGNPDER